jgi:predicted RNA-binding Zn-ribbon protein involved in translation (DUF1610 family)
MSAESPDIERETLKYVCVLVVIVLTIVAFLGIFLFDFFWVFMLPFAFFIIIAIQAFSHYFWRAERKCPRCETQVSLYTDRCPNCGFQLITKCPQCNAPMRYDDETCNKCGYTTKKLVIPDNVELEFEYKEKDYTKKKLQQPAGEVFAFCPHCGSKLSKDQQNLRYCEICGGKLR